VDLCSALTPNFGFVKPKSVDNSFDREDISRDNIRKQKTAAKSKSKTRNKKNQGEKTYLVFCLSKKSNTKK
jgi:hypothetical protein